MVDSPVGFSAFHLPVAYNTCRFWKGGWGKDLMGLGGVTQVSGDRPDVGRTRTCTDADTAEFGSIAWQRARFQSNCMRIHGNIHVIFITYRCQAAGEGQSTAAHPS